MNKRKIKIRKLEQLKAPIPDVYGRYHVIGFALDEIGFKVNEIIDYLNKTN